MIQLVVRLFAKNYKDIEHPEVRTLYGLVCAWVGIILNLFLFIIKFLAGSISGSVAIIADAFNNLSDSGSSIVTLLGFHLSSKKPDADHPYGHGRIEYIAGLIVALFIFIMGIELFKSAIKKIVNPSEIETSLVVILILVFSIMVKCYMAYFNNLYGKRINSSVLKAAATDSLSDSLATSVVLLAMIIQHFTSWKIDGWCGLFVSVAVIYAAFRTAKDTIQPLLGMPPSQEFVEEVEKIVLSYEIVEGIHDLIVHDYGPGRCMISLDAEVAGDLNIFLIHDQIDQIEKELNQRLGCESTIHMDPIAVGDPWADQNRDLIEEMVQRYNKDYSIHDFRIVVESTHTKLIFDVLIPRDEDVDEEELGKMLEEEVKKMNSNYSAVIKIDRSYF